jgi:hypothetical protein
MRCLEECVKHVVAVAEWKPSISISSFPHSSHLSPAPSSPALSDTSMILRAAIQIGSEVSLPVCLCVWCVRAVCVWRVCVCVCVCDECHGLFVCVVSVQQKPSHKKTRCVAVIQSTHGLRPLDGSGPKAKRLFLLCIFLIVPFSADGSPA